MRNIYNILEFNIIRDNIAQFVKTEIGLERTRSLSLIENKDNLISELNILKEAINCLQRYSVLPLNSSLNFIPMIELAIKGGILTPHDFYALVNDINSVDSINDYFRKIKDKYVLLGDKVSQFYDLTPLKNNIIKIINKDLSINDHASDALYNLRRKIKRLENDITSDINAQFNKYKDYLSDMNITLRDGYYVLPVQTSFKNKVDGIVCDVSDSGQTTFIEPSSIVNLSNELYITRKKEAEEIKLILKALTESLVSHKDEIAFNNKLLGYLDFVFAKAQYAVISDANVINISYDGIINLVNMAHPLIDKKVVVKNSYCLNKDNRILLISGPNAGGKTVTLKTTGLFALMNQSGLALPCSESSCLPLFNNIFIDIGDAQSISDNLSTFSGHIRNLVYILDEVKEGDLVLIDEIGTGTSPQEGEALAYSIINQLINKKCYALISSHYEGLKAFALSNNNIENASMVFDDKALKPTYVLKQGLPGKSYGLEMAKRYKMDNKVIAQSYRYLKGQEVNSLNDALSSLNKKETELNNEKARLHNDITKQEEINKALEKEKRVYENKIESFNSSIEEEKEKILAEINKEVEQVIKDLSRPNIKLHEAIEIKSRLNKNHEISDESEIIDQEIRINDYVSIINTDFEGKVVSINNKRVNIITDSGLSVKTTLEKIKKINPPENNQSTRVTPMVLLSPISSEINVIGLHVDEALIEVDRYLNDAIVHHMKEVRVVHGMGSGALRNAIHEFLKKQTYVKSFSLAPSNLGGSGATIVSLL